MTDVDGCFVTCIIQVVQVSTCGPASDAKMTPRAPGALSERLCDWIITEIDGEPVSLLGKKDEVGVLFQVSGFFPYILLSCRLHLGHVPRIE